MRLHLLFLLTFISLNNNAVASDWQTVGAGNATCEHWKRMPVEGKQEVLSWMAGFSTAENLDRATEGHPQYRMKMLTYNYLRIEIDEVCSLSKNHNESMFSILLKILQRFPTEHK